MISGSQDSQTSADVHNTGKFQLPDPAVSVSDFNSLDNFRFTKHPFVDTFSCNRVEQEVLARRPYCKYSIPMVL